MAIAAESRTSGSEGRKKIKMSRLSSPDNAATSATAAAAPPPARKKDPGVRIMGSRIYDSTNGKTCHQCRQKTMDFAASCTMLKKGDKLCTIKFCYKCLLNRYGEKAEEAEALGNWICPKCRGICNCSFCMKKKGQQPTGMLVHTAKATGYSSVLELLENRGSEGLNSDNIQVCDKGVVPSKKRLVNETVHADDDDSNCLAPPDGREKKRQKKEQMKLVQKFKKENESDSGLKARRKDAENIVLPEGTPLTEVAGIEFSVEDVGPALQFLEFCEAFSEVLHIKRGEPESILQEVVGKCPVLRPSSSSIVQFHIKLLSLIRKDRGESMPVSYSMRNGTSWLEAFGKCINESECPPKDLHPDFFNEDLFEYNNLDTTTKLRMLNFLCDETLSTGDLRRWIEQENTKFNGKKKELRAKVLAAKRKAKDLKEKLKIGLAKPMLSPHEGASLSVSGQNDLISEIRTESEKAHADFLESVDLLPEKKQGAVAVRTEPLFLDGSGHAYWKLGSSCGSSSILHQDFQKWDLITPQDKWFFFDEEKEKLVEKHISSLSNNGRERKEKIKMSPPSSPENAATSSVVAPTRKKNPRVCIIESHIYDSMNGKTCHQKMMDFAASCTMLKKGDKHWAIMFCHKCLLNRYGEKVEEVDALGSWICLKCWGICNCSLGMKRKGLQPTGILVHTAKAIGCSLVLELLDRGGSEGLNSDNALVHDKGVVPYKRQLVSEKIHVEVDDPNCQTPADGGEEGKKLRKLLKKLKKVNEHGNDFENRNGPQQVLKLKYVELLAVESQQDRENSDKRTNPEALSSVLKLRKQGMKGLCKQDLENIVLPQGTPLVQVAGIEFSVEDVGLTLLFLEICKAFSKVKHYLNWHLASSVIYKIELHLHETSPSHHYE